VIELRSFRLFLANLAGHFVLNSVFQSLETSFGLGGECVPAMGSNNTNTVSCGLSKTCTLVSSKAANSLHDKCVIGGWEVVWSKVFHHVVQNEKTEFFSLLNFTGERIIKDLLS